MTLEPDIFQVKIEELKSNSQEVLNLCLKEAPSDFDSFQSEFRLEINAESEVNAIVGWFDAEMTEDTWFSTSPLEGDTHLHQTIFPVIESFKMKCGDILRGNIRVKPIDDDHRGLHVTLAIT